MSASVTLARPISIWLVLPEASVVVIFMPRGIPRVVLRWRLARQGRVNARLRVRPFFSGRDYHSTHHENGAFGFQPGVERDGVWIWRPYEGLPGVRVRANGTQV